MISSKDLPMLLMIVGGFVVVFCLSCLPGIITNDSLSHEFGMSDRAMMFNQDGGVKKSFWSWDSMVKSKPGAYQPAPVVEGDLQANPFTD